MPRILFIGLLAFSLLSCNGQTERKGPSSPVSKLLRPFTFVTSCDQDDPLLKEILEEDLKGLQSPLELLSFYTKALNRGTSHGKIGHKLDKLFSCGRIPQDMKGYYHGITISLKTGLDIYSVLEEIRGKLGVGKEIDIIQVLYGRVLSDTSPWAGKTFKRVESDVLSELKGRHQENRGPAYLGLNSFRKDQTNIVNNVANFLLPMIIDMKAVPKPDKKQRSWIQSTGGFFIAQQSGSIDPVNPGKEVLALNYRWDGLSNRLPNRLLIDEIVEIAEGLFLGKLFYATAPQHLFAKYDPDVKQEDYKYRGFGYFMLMDDTWLQEKNRLFPKSAYTLGNDLHGKYTTFSFIDSHEAKAIQRKMNDHPTILHYLQDIYEGIQKGPASKDLYFDELHKIFMCGKRPDGINGFFHGGVLTFNNAGLLKKLERIVLNDIYPAVRPFSPWSGKTFTLTTEERLKKYIGGDARYYEGVKPIILGTNTYRKELDLSLPVTAFVEHLDKIGMVVEYPNEAEKRREIHVKSFYFIAANGTSFNPSNRGKEVLQFNYRWPGLHTMPPDHLCFDELVEIAEGLYLGQLLYSTRPDIPYDPKTDPSVYQYENFGYFMLMDDDWRAIKEFILFDTSA